MNPTTEPVKEGAAPAEPIVEGQPPLDAPAPAPQPLSEEGKAAVLEFVADTVTAPKKPSAKPKPGEAEAAAPKKPAKPAPKAKPAPAAPPVDDYERMERLARATAEGVVKAIQPKPATEPVKDEPKLEFLTEEERKRLPVFERMAKNNPDRYKTAVKDYTEHLKAIDEYQKKWESENSDKEFDPEDEEHSEFYAKHEFDWDEDDFTEAKAQMIAERTIQEANKTLENRLTAAEQREEARALGPVVFAERVKAAKSLFEKVGGDFTKIWENGQFNQSVCEKIIKEDKLAWTTVIPIVQNLEGYCEENMRLEKGVVNFDGNNGVHLFLADFADKAEKEILSLPSEKRVNKEGKKFVRSSEYNRMDAAERVKHYRLVAQDLNRILVADLTRRAVDALARARKDFEETAASMGYSKSRGAGGMYEAPEEDVEKPKPVGLPAEAVATPGGGRRQHNVPKDEAALIGAILD